MNKYTNKWFTLVELLVSITILAIISVVAYQSFGWATSKAQNARKTQDLTTIETSLNMIYSEKNYYPLVGEYNNTNEVFGYNSAAEAQPSNTFKASKKWAEIDTLADAKGGWKIYWTWTFASKQIWAKWTISQNVLGKQYLTKDLYDIEVWDLKDSTGATLISKWIGRYVYATYNRWLTSTNWTSNMTWTSYNLAASFKIEEWDGYFTKIVWPYSNENCGSDKDKCPKTLIWSKDNVLINWQKLGEKSDWSLLTDINSEKENQGIPYPVTNF